MSWGFFNSYVSFFSFIFWLKNPRPQQQQNTLLQSLLLTCKQQCVLLHCLFYCCCLHCSVKYRIPSCSQCRVNTLLSFQNTSYWVLLRPGFVSRLSWYMCLCCWLQCTKYNAPYCWLQLSTGLHVVDQSVSTGLPVVDWSVRKYTRCPAVERSVSTSRPVVDCNVRIGLTVVDCTVNTYLPVVDWSVPLHRK